MTSFKELHQKDSQTDDFPVMKLSRIKKKEHLINFSENKVTDLKSNLR